MMGDTNKLNNTNMKILIFSFLSLIITIGCTDNSKKKETSIIEAQFDIEKSLLNEQPFIDSILNFSINVPVEYFFTDPFFLATLAKSLIQDYRNAHIISGFTNVKDTSLMLIIDISNIDSKIYENLKVNYKSLLNQNNNWSDIQFQEFKHNCFKIEQYVLQNSALLNFRLICYNYNNFNQPLIEVLFFINRKNIEKNIRSVESSIGSLKCLTYKNLNYEKN